MDDGRVMVGDTCMKELDGISIKHVKYLLVNALHFVGTC